MASGRAFENTVSDTLHWVAAARRETPIAWAPVETGRRQTMVRSFHSAKCSQNVVDGYYRRRSQKQLQSQAPYKRNPNN